MLQTLEDLLTVHGDVLRSIDADPNLVASDTQDGDGHVVADHQDLSDAAREDEQSGSPTTALIL